MAPGLVIEDSSDDEAHVAHVFTPHACLFCDKALGDAEVQQGVPCVQCTSCGQRACGVSRCLGGWVLFLNEQGCPECSMGLA